MNTKICSKCKEKKSVDKFYKHVNCAGGIRPNCKVCCNADCKDRLARDPLLNRRHHLRRKFGIDHKRYEEILSGQGGGCAICGSTLSRNGQRLAIDHDHETGVIRGVLCDKCNRGIGLLNDSPELLQRAREYLMKAKNHGPKTVVSFN